MENPKDLQKKKNVLELIHVFSNVKGYKTNAQKSAAFLYTNNEATEKEIQELISFRIAQKP